MTIVGGLRAGIELDAFELALPTCGNPDGDGYCEDCGADIGVRRLEARPTAAKCIDCKTYAEIREKQVGDA